MTKGIEKPTTKLRFSSWAAVVIGLKPYCKLSWCGKGVTLGCSFFELVMIGMD